MEKSIKCLKEEVSKLRGYAVIIDGEDGELEPVTTVSVEDIYELINQLDKREVLSQEENINIVLDDLKEHIKEQQTLSQNIGLAHTSAGNDTHYRQYDYVLECINEYEPSEDLQNLIVPKQEKVKIESVWAEDIEDAKASGMTLFKAMDWMAIDSDDEEKQDLFAKAWLYGYEVEEEQKYIIKIGNLYLAEPLGDMTSDIVRMTRNKEIAHQFADEKSIATHLDKFEGTEAIKVEEMEE